jgi:hypothetical protein
VTFVVPGEHSSGGKSRDGREERENNSFHDSIRSTVAGSLVSGNKKAKGNLVEYGPRPKGCQKILNLWC